MALLTLYHWTARKNLRSIRRTGLSTQFAKTADRHIYAVEVELTHWGMLHVAARHGWWPGDLVCVVCYVDSETVKAHGVQGVWKSADTIPPARLWIIEPIRPTRRPTRRRATR